MADNKDDKIKQLREMMERELELEKADEAKRRKRAEAIAKLQEERHEQTRKARSIKQEEDKLTRQIGLATNSKAFQSLEAERLQSLAKREKQKTLLQEIVEETNKKQQKRSVERAANLAQEIEMCETAISKVQTDEIKR